MDRIRILSNQVLAEYKPKFGSDFAKNKEALNEVTIIRSKGLKNEIAGYITKVIKNEEREEAAKARRIEKARREAEAAQKAEQEAKEAESGGSQEDGAEPSAEAPAAEPSAEADAGSAEAPVQPEPAAEPEAAVDPAPGDAKL